MPSSAELMVILPPVMRIVPMEVSSFSALTASLPVVVTLILPPLMSISLSPEMPLYTELTFSVSSLISSIESTPILMPFLALALMFSVPPPLR